MKCKKCKQRTVVWHKTKKGDVCTACYRVINHSVVEADNDAEYKRILRKSLGLKE